MYVVGYEPRRPTDQSDSDGDLLATSTLEPATLLIRADDETDHPRAVTSITLKPGTTLGYGLGSRRCAGALEGTTHYPCDRPTGPHCDLHASTWVCARCTGTCLKDEMDCDDDHAIYLAAFAPDTYNVGVTKRWRLETRLREQGADRAAHVGTVSNGRIARDLEAEIAARSGVVDRVRTESKVASLARSVDGAAWEALLANNRFDVIAATDFDWGLGLETQPVAETMLTGTVVGTKGRLLVLERAGTTYVVDMRDLVGHELESGDGEERTRLQSSLGSFS